MTTPLRLSFKPLSGFQATMGFQREYCATKAASWVVSNETELPRCHEQAASRCWSPIRHMSCWKAQLSWEGRKNDQRSQQVIGKKSLE